MTEANDWRKEYVGMPEYNNEKQPPPLITLTFKFDTQEEYDEFHKLVKDLIFDGERILFGTQRKHVKQAWYPLREKVSDYVWK